ncbi:hypothetical protein SAMN04515667_1964 [Formosa sp. Hel1_31_208]|uniref:hypothetical protein n=1 Tax=Formosa sp. Hel1_31_208 TaxID=1798225 RepID=UPI00087D5BF3|nr:hypothetical protein [Formosa sp. Hel1_31_208]SDS34441.1 hypothetical protein SAMN04515667_1964 [Formosa sp. Hel1_31_208]
MENKTQTSCCCSAPPKAVPSKKGNKKMSALNICTGVLFFLFPKCPVCWAAYASLLSFFGLEQVGYSSSWKYIILAVFLLGSFFLLRKHYLNKSWPNMILYAAGMLLLLTSYSLNLDQTWWLYVVALMIVLSNFSLGKAQKLIG